MRGDGMSKVKDVMITKLETCTPDTNLAVVGAKMWNNDCGILPVLDYDGKILGVITDRDICIALATRDQIASQVIVQDAFSGKIFSCKPEDDVKTALQIMREARVRRLPVVTVEGQLVGLLSLDDAAVFAQDVIEPRSTEVSYKDVAITFKDICGRRDIEVKGELAAHAV
jgi:CBS domain-containing protein